MVMMAPAMAPAATMCVNPGAPVDVPVGMPGEALDAGLCAQLGLPIGTTWGANAASVRNLQVRSWVNSLWENRGKGHWLWLDCSVTCRLLCHMSTALSHVLTFPRLLCQMGGMMAMPVQPTIVASGVSRVLGFGFRV